LYGYFSVFNADIVRIAEGVFPLEIVEMFHLIGVYTGIHFS